MKNSDRVTRKQWHIIIGRFHVWMYWSVLMFTLAFDNDERWWQNEPFSLHIKDAVASSAFLFVCVFFPLSLRRVEKKFKYISRLLFSVFFCTEREKATTTTTKKSLNTFPFVL